MSTWTEYPDGGHTWLRPGDGPLVTVRFADGGQADFRPGSDWPRHARVLYRGLDVKGLRVDVDATVEPDGTVSVFSVHKTDVAGADGGCDVPVKVRESVTALCRRRAREARSALWTAGHGTRNGVKQQEGQE